MKFFLDTAIVEDIKNAVQLGMCDGVTTNPTLIMKSGRDHMEVIKEISSIVDGPISVEGNGMTADEMIKEGKEFSTWGKNIVVKVPMTEEGLKAVRVLEKEGIKTNVTLVFSPSQALLAAKAGASYVSPFVGRLDDISHDGMFLVDEIKQIYSNYGYKTEIIVASIRHPLHVVEAAKAGADIATIPAKVLSLMWNHPLTDKGIQKFLEDSKKNEKH
ncbi:fructose-6-phosphate aldolase [Candidatus Micrarchaeota archaeon]|nr:fructose-6-phosphate aldolase [Candidatus Micrarchaeota archaeon]